MAHDQGCGDSRSDRPRFEVADIFRTYGHSYLESHTSTPEQRAVMRAIEQCRTSALGGHLDVCDSCGYQKPSYNSCRDRHCPKCQALAQARWLEGRRDRILPTDYFHVVFTLPAELRPLAMKNRSLVYEALFQAASATLRDLSQDPKRLGAQIGWTAVLHTWTRDLRFHPHLHCIVTGGGLSSDSQRWVSAPRSYLFPVKVLGRLFRGKLMAALNRARDEQRLDMPHSLAPPLAFERLCKALFAKNWVVYAKRPFADAEQVYSYLGRYTHRVGISNQRILSVTDGSVTIATRGGATATMAPHEFIRRFLNHVLPKAFRKIRHYGLLASSNVNTKLPTARRLLAPSASSEAEPRHHIPLDSDWKDLFEALSGVDLRTCPACQRGRLSRVKIPRPPFLPPSARPPPPRMRIN